jgi:hypothetical protein
MGQCNTGTHVATPPTGVAVKVATMVATYCKLWVVLPTNQVKRRMIHNFDALKFMWKNTFALLVCFYIYIGVIVPMYSPCYCQCFESRLMLIQSGYELVAVIILPLHWPDAGETLISGSSVADPNP